MGLRSLSANYTEFYETLCEDNDRFRARFVEYMTQNGFTTDMAQKLDEMIYNKFWNWEVWTLDYADFVESMRKVFSIYAAFYREKIDAYNTQINFLDGDKRSVAMESSQVSTPRVKTTSENYDLPRSDASNTRPSSKTISGPTEGTDVIGTAGTTTYTGGNVIELKRRYLDIIRSYYSEFADKFRINFIELFC